MSAILLLAGFMTRGKHAKVRWGYATISEVPRNMIGVYAIWYRPTGKCVYVGKAPQQPVRERLRQHWRDCENRTLRLWLSVFGDRLDLCYAQVDDPRRIDRLERKLIRLWHPEANIQHNERLGSARREEG